jgi:hypothetical protein
VKPGYGDQGDQKKAASKKGSAASKKAKWFCLAPGEQPG